MTHIFDTIEKPVLLLDEDKTRQNIHRIAERARSASVSFRPHFKTHQSAEIGQWFRAEGVSSITVSSVDMARYFCEAGWEDITIAFPANIRQKRELVDLARRIQLGVLVESVETVNALAEAGVAPANVWLKIDTGLHRTGIAWDQPDSAAQVIREVQSAPGLHLRGLLTHGGQSYTARGTEDVCRKYQESTSRIDGLRQTLNDQGLGPLQISVGDTPSASLCADLGPVDEIRPGNFVFYDSQQVQIGSCAWQDVSVALACPVVARHPERSEIVVYGGAVHLSKDFLVNDGQRSYGMVCLPDDQTGRWGPPLNGAFVASISQEHGVIRLDPADVERISVGSLVCVLPAHSCLTVTLMKRYLTFSGMEIDTMNA